MRVIIFTPLELEYMAVRINLTELVKNPVNGIIYEKGIFKGKYIDYEIILCQTGATNKLMAIATERAVQHFKPSIAILSGIAGGIKDVALASVVVGTKVYDYESGKETENGFVARPNVLNFSTDLISFAESISREGKWQSRLNTTNLSSKVFFGAIAAGEKVIASTDSELYKRIKLHYNDTIAVEMEAYGFLKSLENHRFVKSMCVRGISDLLDNKSESDGQGSQPIAAANSAGFVFELLDHLDRKFLKLPVLEPRALSKEVFQTIDLILNQEIEISEPFQNLIDKIEQVIPESFNELISDRTDEDAPAVFRSSLRKKLEKEKELIKELTNLLNASKAMEDKKSINSETNIKKSEINKNKGTVIIGGQHTKSNNIENNQGTIYIADTINIEQVLDDDTKTNKVKVDTNIDSIRSLISQNKIKPAIELLLELTKNSTEKNSAILFASRWNDLQKQKQSGLITTEQYHIQHNRIVIGVLGLLDDLDA